VINIDWKLLPKFVPKGRIPKIDFIYEDSLGCTYDDFTASTFVDYRSTFDKALQIRLRDAHFTDSPLIEYMARKNILRFYESKVCFGLRYGTFNGAVTSQALCHGIINERDIDDATEYINNLNDAFNTAVKAKIKKGKLKVII